MPANEQHWSAATRLGGLRRFAIAITFLNVLGHTVLGFEQSWAQPLFAVAVAYFLETLLELVDAKARSRPTRFGTTVVSWMDFLLSAHITGLAVSMLLYANERLWVVGFATAVAIGSKFIFRVPIGPSSRHFLNPSNFGITVTLLAFPWVGIAPPYQFTENLTSAGDWILPALIVVSGSFLNARYTRRLPLIGAWLGCFALQALLRSVLTGAPLLATLNPMTGLAFVLYTFYMVTDPATTPNATRGQIAFGASVAFAYSVLMLMHVVFGLFFALTAICVIRGTGLYVRTWVASRKGDEVGASEVVAFGRPQV